MKWMIASDLHGSYFYASQMQQAFEREQADRLLLLGDLLYHGPRNDLPEGYAPKEVIPPLAPGDILLHGHTHIPAWEPFGQGSLYLNPGSVSLPKEGSAHSYMTLENGCFRWKTMDGRTYHELTLSET